MQLKIKKLNEHAKTPIQATKGSACFDVHALVNNPTRVTQECPVVFGTGLSFELPEGFALMVYSRSGHAFKNNLRLANSVGVLDSDYRGELKVKLAADGEPYQIKPGERIAQVMLLPLPMVELVMVDELSSTTRGEGGFGSTGS